MSLRHNYNANNLYYTNNSIHIIEDVYVVPIYIGYH